MVEHSRSPWTEDFRAGLRSIGSQELGQVTEADLACTDTGSKRVERTGVLA